MAHTATHHNVTSLYCNLLNRRNVLRNTDSFSPLVLSLFINILDVKHPEIVPHIEHSSLMHELTHYTNTYSFKTITPTHAQDFPPDHPCHARSQHYAHLVSITLDHHQKTLNAYAKHLKQAKIKTSFGHRLKYFIHKELHHKNMTTRFYREETEKRYNDALMTEKLEKTLLTGINNLNALQERIERFWWQNRHHAQSV